MKKFDAIWVPDHPEPPGLADTLSHGKAVHQEVNYIGILSRMEYLETEIEYDLAVVLSGPEPQRTYLEHRLLEQILALPLKSIVIRGKTHTKEHYYAADQVEFVSYLTSKELNKVLLASKWVICRSGYSSIMDLVVLRKKALLIPTPGQTEQEYLAQQLAQKGIFLIQNQENLDLEKAISGIKSTSGFLENNFDKNFYHIQLRKWLDQVQQDP
jgi:predicted glycosyltransferase